MQKVFVIKGSKPDEYDPPDLSTWKSDFFYKHNGYELKPKGKILKRVEWISYVLVATILIGHEAFFRLGSTNCESIF